MQNRAKPKLGDIIARAMQRRLKDHEVVPFILDVLGAWTESPEGRAFQVWLRGYERSLQAVRDGGKIPLEIDKVYMRVRLAGPSVTEDGQTIRGSEPIFKAGLIWCLHCERVYRSPQIRKMPDGQNCCAYEDCDGDAIIDGWPYWEAWERHGWPEIAIPGVVYALYDKKSEDYWFGPFSPVG